MAQMPVAFGTAHLNTDHSVRRIAIFGNHIGRGRLGKAGPARSAVIFGARFEEQRTTTPTEEIAVALFKIELSTECPFGARFAQDMILDRGKARAPFFFAEFEFFHVRNVCLQRPRVKSDLQRDFHWNLTIIGENRYKMYRGLSLPFLLCAVLLAPQQIGAQAFGSDPFTRQGDTKARPLNIEIRSSLDFSRATATGANGGSIAIDPNSGMRTVSGNVVDLGGSPFAGSAVITGEPGRAIRIEMPSTIKLSSATGGSVEIVGLRTNLSPAPRLDIYGRLEFAFGGNLMIKGNVSGQFRGRIPITAEYE